MRVSSTSIVLLLILGPLTNVTAKKKTANLFSSKGNKKGKRKPSLDDDVELVVRYRNEKGKEDLKLEANDGKVDKDFSRFHVATLKTKRSKVNKIAKDPNIEAVAESQTYHALPHTRGGHVKDERNLAQSVPYGIGLVQADLVPQGSTPIKVCVIDTGYGLGHPDLPTSSHGVDGYSPYGGSERWDVDGDGHGTHCAGIIGAVGNSRGVVGVNPDPTKFTFYIGKGLTNGGSGTTTNIIAAVEKCVEVGAKVISMSLGCDGCYSSVEEAAMKDAYNEGVLIIAAAGNSGNSALSYPASYATVMSVGAVDSNRNIAGFSQHNSQVEISAPGVGVRSTVTTNNGSSFNYATWDGTSMATPHVAGVAALVWSHFPQCSNNQIRNVLIKTSLDSGSSGCDEFYGFGIVQAKAAFDLLSAQGCEAGGADLGQFSNGASGGCDQDPDYVPPPTAAPTAFQCDGVVVTVQLRTDNYGEETSWELKDSTGSVKASGSAYSSLTSYEEKKCVSAVTCTFTIMDSYGDGICCGYGSGSYSVSRSGTTFNRDGIFDSSETIDICEGATLTGSPTSSPSESPTQTPTESPTSSPSDSPTEAPTTPPTSAPSDSPTETPTDSPTTSPPVTSPIQTPTPSPTTPPSASPTTLSSSSPTKTPTLSPTRTPTPPSPPPPVSTVCSSSETDVNLSIFTDNYPGETRWNIVNWLTNSEVEVGGPYLLQGESFSKQMCIPKGCYVFTITDSYGDGMCCGHGAGSYSLAVDGVTLVSNGGAFDSKAYALFGNCQSQEISTASHYKKGAQI